MSSKTIGLIADSNFNINILVWSLYYLNGQSHYYYHGFDYWFDVVDDPIDRALITDTSDRCVIEIEYDGTSAVDEFAEQIASLKAANDYDGLRIITTRLTHENALTPEIVDIMKAECDKVIVISSFGEPTLYSNKFYKELEFMVDDFMETYFSDSKLKWDDPDNSPWDRREYIALNFRPFVAMNPELAYDLSTIEHHKITYSDLYENFIERVKGVFDFIGNPIDESRFDSWTAIYSEWQKSVNDIVIWNRDFKKIVAAIVAGVEYDITRYRLDLLREAALLHELLYKHNLSIKGHGLEELPQNTKEIHALLEPNFHQLPPY